MNRTKSVWRRLWQHLVPTMTDFHALLEEQCVNLESAIAVLTAFLQKSDRSLAETVHDRVHEGHALRDRNLLLLYKSFVTQIDREDIYTLCMSIDHILDYVKNTVREVEILQVESDKWMLGMVEQLGLGAASLARGLELFRTGHARDVPDAVITRHLERQVEKLYRNALMDMFRGAEYRALTEAAEQPSAITCLEFVISRIKRREVYRHLSNAADRIAHAGEALRDISIKYE